MARIGLKGRVNENAIIKYFILGMRDEELYSAFQGQRIEYLTDLRDRVQWCLSIRKSATRDDKPKTATTPQLVPEKIKSENKEQKRKTTNNKTDCFNCFKAGHFARECPEPSRRPRCTKCNKVHRKGEPVECSGQAYVGVMNCRQMPTVYHKFVYIDDYELVGQIDSGSPCTLIRRHNANHISADRIPCRLSISGFLGGTYLATEKISVEIKIDDAKIQAQMYVVNDDCSPVPILIGRDVLDSPRVGMIKENGSLKIYLNQPNKIDHELKVKRPKITNNEIQCGSLNDNDKTLMMNLVNDYKDLFPLELKHIGLTDRAEMEIVLHPDDPIQQRAYRVPYAKLERINESVQELIDNDIVVPSKSDFASPALLVKKKMDRTAYV